ncbi:MAG: hypothetical protein A3I44_01650 [Candidatus Sungbacteria bacterium RIFCSPLOWO2_02_FULL_51_17]|nr:MAG: hypothetical protein A2676_03300 [Candidatus Sungbacteria bacterium RIFCSPHIGHO2_01_FULL_51_22]OHA12639.1 MAG: hypothetical protein A3I44_01650 [Candidatus Sungbacteria bacterium RIFCSPLOWO2_02_FULL_51_17]
MNTKTLGILLALGCIGLIAIPAFGHSGGASIEKTVGEYIIDIGYSETDLRAGTPLRFDLQLLSASSTTNVISVDDVWVRIRRVRDNVYPLVGRFHMPALGPAGMTYEFSEPGEYSMTVRFQKHDKAIVEADIPLTILASEDDKKTMFSPGAFGAGTLGLLIGLVGSLLVHRRRRNNDGAALPVS